MAATYRVEVIHVDREAWARAIDDAIRAEVLALGLHRSVTIEFGPDRPTEGPAISLYLGSPVAAVDPRCVDAVQEAINEARTVLPVVADLADFATDVPRAVQSMNGWKWRDDSVVRLARWVLEELGIEERQRRVFISHKRDDGLFAAEQLYEHLGKHGFDPFVDRFDIRAAEDVARRIADALEQCAFLLLLESPLAHTSDWVFDEVDYALTHTMGIHIVRWPGQVEDVPGSGRLPRHLLQAGDLKMERGYDALTDAALDAILGEVEAAHAAALVRRRRQLLRNVEDAAESQGLVCTPLASWRLLVEGAGRRDIVAVTGRLPMVEDLFGLDVARMELESSGDVHEAVLVHSARRLDLRRRQLLEWSTSDRPVALVPENAIGGYW